MLKLGIDSQPDLQPSGLADVQERMFLKLGSPRTPRWREQDSNHRSLWSDSSPEALRFVADFLLEGTGFEPSVPLAEWEAIGVGASISKGAFVEPCAFKPRAW